MEIRNSESENYYEIQYANLLAKMNLIIYLIHPSFILWAGSVHILHLYNDKRNFILFNFIIYYLLFENSLI